MSWIRLQMGYSHNRRVYSIGRVWIMNAVQIRCRPSGFHNPNSTTSDQNEPNVNLWVFDSELGKLGLVLLDQSASPIMQSIRITRSAAHFIDPKPRRHRFTEAPLNSFPSCARRWGFMMWKKGNNTTWLLWSPVTQLVIFSSVKTVYGSHTPLFGPWSGGMCVCVCVVSMKPGTWAIDFKTKNNHLNCWFPSRRIGDSQYMIDTMVASIWKEKRGNSTKTE